eukprot:363076-Pelagomonas_calceolata.AAC.5
MDAVMDAMLQAATLHHLPAAGTAHTHHLTHLGSCGRGRGLCWKARLFSQIRDKTKQIRKTELSTEVQVRFCVPGVCSHACPSLARGGSPSRPSPSNRQCYIVYQVVSLSQWQYMDPPLEPITEGQCAQHKVHKTRNLSALPGTEPFDKQGQCMPVRNVHVFMLKGIQASLAEDVCLQGQRGCPSVFWLQSTAREGTCNCKQHGCTL